MPHAKAGKDLSTRHHTLRSPDCTQLHQIRNQSGLGARLPHRLLHHHRLPRRRQAPRTLRRIAPPRARPADLARYFAVLVMTLQRQSREAASAVGNERRTAGDRGGDGTSPCETAPDSGLITPGAAAVYCGLARGSLGAAEPSLLSAGASGAHARQSRIRSSSRHLLSNTNDRPNPPTRSTGSETTYTLSTFTT